ncbi:nucleotidyltransferase [Clostridium sp. DJ247]|uniref:nucleotidyltransferase n=1 Tax=Clostridium sp. DJ247 TaxID=2726188 RepID=UPI00162A8172|nr:nucleotidyltransferase [Clostridium sp. DJ247]MBC2578959.1 nucleotidyltransferase [Clostridium sp. DJ247]
MNITGIVVEYNPFHKGHLYHLQKTKELTKCDAIIAVMSGNFAQRGTPAVVDKWNRTKMALTNGVDLVLELPLIYSMSSAEFFSYGAVSLLNGLGVVNNICFGSEYGNVDILNYIAKILTEEPYEFKELLKNKLNIGLSYPDARAQSLQEFILNYNSHNIFNLNLEEILYSSNNILGIEYCKSLLRLQSKIIPFSVKRKGASFSSVSLDHEFSSATSIREHIKLNNDLNGLKNYLPENVYSLLISLKDRGYTFTFENSMLPYIKYKYTMYKDMIKNLPDVSEGIENRIYKFLYETEDLNSLISLIKTKRYTYTRINRILCQFFIGFENFNTYELRKNPCPYARVLGFNNKGIEILKLIKHNSSIPVYSKLPKDQNAILSLDILGTKVYSLLNRSVHPNSDYLISPIRIKESL